LKILADEFKKTVKEKLGSEFPDDAKAQLIGVSNVFKSWNGKKAVSYVVSKIYRMIGNRSKRAGNGVW